MTPAPKSKKKYFKKEKKSMQPKRHKAPSAKAKSVKGKESVLTQPQKFQFPNIYRFITESFTKTKSSKVLEPLVATKKEEKMVKVSKDKAKFDYKLLYTRHFWMSGILLGALIFAGFLSWKLWQEYTRWVALKDQHAQVEKDLKTWEEMTNKYPTYRDAYFEAAVLAYRLGDIQKEQEFLQKLQQIDPNFTMANQLEQMSRGK